MFLKHNVSFHVIFNKDLEFLLKKFCSLDTALNMWLHFTSGYYLKDDKQTEHINQILEQYL